MALNICPAVASGHAAQHAGMVSWVVPPGWRLVLPRRVETHRWSRLIHPVNVTRLMRGKEPLGTRGGPRGGGDVSIFVHRWMHELLEGGVMSGYECVCVCACVHACVCVSVRGGGVRAESSSDQYSFIQKELSERKAEREKKFHSKQINDRNRMIHTLEHTLEHTKHILQSFRKTLSIRLTYQEEERKTGRGGQEERRRGGEEKRREEKEGREEEEGSRGGWRGQKSHNFRTEK